MKYLISIIFSLLFISAGIVSAQQSDSVLRLDETDEAVETEVVRDDLKEDEEVRGSSPDDENLDRPVVTEIDLREEEDESETKKKGNAETTWKIEEGEKSPEIEIEDIDAEPTEPETTEAGIFIEIDDIEGDSDSVADNDPHKDWINLLSVSEEESEQNKMDLLDEITNGSGGGLRSGYIKIGDIKGESSESREGDGLDVDSDGDGLEDTKVEKAREIIVVGSKVRGDDVPQIRPESDNGDEIRAESFFDIWVEVEGNDRTTADSFFDVLIDSEADSTEVDSFFDIFVDVSDEDLQLQAVSIAQTNDDVRSVEVLESEVRVEYDENMRLFGLIPIQSTRTITVRTDQRNEQDRVSVQFPWWHIFATKNTNANDLEENINAELDITIPKPFETGDRPTEEVTFYYNKIQAQTLQTISNVSK